jgi:hypothetical protein
MSEFIGVGHASPAEIVSADTKWRRVLSVVDAVDPFPVIVNVLECG